MCLDVLTQSTNEPDGRTNGRTEWPLLNALRGKIVYLEAVRRRRLILMLLLLLLLLMMVVVMMMMMMLILMIS